MKVCQEGDQNLPLELGRRGNILELQRPIEATSNLCLDTSNIQYIGLRFFFVTRFPLSTSPEIQVFSEVVVRSIQLRCYTLISSSRVAVQHQSMATQLSDHVLIPQNTPSNEGRATPRVGALFSQVDPQNVNGKSHSKIIGTLLTFGFDML